MAYIPIEILYSIRDELRAIRQALEVVADKCRQ
jgi:hypothetical protein